MHHFGFNKLHLIAGVSKSSDLNREAPYAFANEMRSSMLSISNPAASPRA